MTAQRWWVRLFARWQARIDSVEGQISTISKVVTAFSTFSIVLQGFGLGQYVVPLGVVISLSLPVYAYLFFEGGVWNQVSRDRADMSGNFAGPGALISAMLIALTAAEAIDDEGLTDEDIERARERANQLFEEFRDGVELADE